MTNRKVTWRHPRAEATQGFDPDWAEMLLHKAPVTWSHLFAEMLPQQGSHHLATSVCSFLFSLPWYSRGHGCALILPEMRLFGGILTRWTRCYFRVAVIIGDEIGSAVFTACPQLSMLSHLQIVRMGLNAKSPGSFITLHPPHFQPSACASGFPF